MCKPSLIAIKQYSFRTNRITRRKQMNAAFTQARPAYWLDSICRGIDQRGIDLDPHDAAKFISTLAALRLIRRPNDLFAWLKEAQKFLPHQVLIAAWGDFRRWNVKCELVGHLPGARLTQTRGCALDDVLRDAYTQCLRVGREPLGL